MSQRVAGRGSVARGGGAWETGNRRRDLRSGSRYTKTMVPPAKSKKHGSKKGRR